ncbi:MAG: hypothetical protein IH586_07920, partial [Anaerolineaceae bacterium]|nr:hypothetical protein [Anaerolineaceae bacterium]
MSFLDRILNWEPFFRIRRNHALEHATLQILAEKNPMLRMAGYSDANGFWLIGQVDTAQVREAAEEALSRLKGGENSLAIHPHCGTNLVTTGFLAGSFAWMGMPGVGRNMRERLERLPFIITLVTLAVFLAQPLGPFLQAQVTTSPATPGMTLARIERSQRGDVPMHR